MLFRKEESQLNEPVVSDSKFSKPEYKEIKWERPKKTVTNPDVQSFLNSEKY